MSNETTGIFNGLQAVEADTDFCRSPWWELPLRKGFASVKGQLIVFEWDCL